MPWNNIRNVMKLFLLHKTSYKIELNKIINSILNKK